MILARVKGNVISTTKSDRLEGLSLLIIVPVDIATFEEKGQPLVAIDTVGAGEGEIVMCVGGSSSRQTTVTENKPADLSIIGIVDSVEFKGEKVFQKYSNERRVKGE